MGKYTRVYTCTSRRTCFVQWYQRVHGERCWMREIERDSPSCCLLGHTRRERRAYSEEMRCLLYPFPSPSLSSSHLTLLCHFFSCPYSPFLFCISLSLAPLCIFTRRVFGGENVRFGNPVHQAWSRINSECVSPFNMAVATQLVSLSAGVFCPELMEACQELEELRYQQYQVCVHGNQTM